MEIKGLYKYFFWLLAALAGWQLDAIAQATKCLFANNEFFVEVDKRIDDKQLESFIVQYDLKELNLKKVIATSNIDTLKKLGWKIKLNNAHKLIISRPLEGSSNINDPVSSIIYTDKMPPLGALFPSVDNGVLYGINYFKNKYPFAEKGQQTRFFLRKNQQAHRVMLAGSFNNWQPEALAMRKNDSGWIADINLLAGKHWYKFIVDGNWQHDYDNLTAENDGRGNINSVYFKTNHVFAIKGFTDAKKVFLAGSFNNWKPNKLEMQRTTNGWQLPVYLGQGTHTYKFVVDKNWKEDASNPKKLPDGHGGYNAVIAMGKPYWFKLQGNTNAARVFVAGNFNGWRSDELQLTKTATGWQLPYVLGPGNYEYRFIVDGNWLTDPANPLAVQGGGNMTNSFLIIDANYTFRLKGKPNAKKVYLAGDFNNWSPTSLPMKKDGNDWLFSVHLSPGKHKYKFQVDGQWIMDPNNKDWEQNEYGTGNSVIWISEDGQ